MGRKKLSEIYKSLTVQQFSNQTGIAKSVIQQAIKQGRIAINRKAKPILIYYEHPKTLEYLKEKEEEIKDNSIDFAQQLENRVFTISREELKEQSQEVLKKVKLLADIRKVKTQELAMRNKLIARKTVKIFFQQLMSVDNSIIRPLGQVLSPQISDLFQNTDKQKIIDLQKLIDKEIYQALDIRHKRINEFLESLTPEKDDE